MLAARIETDIVTAMKARDVIRLDTLRMAKTAILNKQKELKANITDSDVQAILSTLVKQRRDSFEQFTQGGRPELAAKEQQEIDILETYMPRVAADDEVFGLVVSVISTIAAGTDGVKVQITPKLMGDVFKRAKAALEADNLRAEGKLLSSIVKQLLEHWYDPR